MAETDPVLAKEFAELQKTEPAKYKREMQELITRQKDPEAWDAKHPRAVPATPQAVPAEQAATPPAAAPAKEPAPVAAPQSPVPQGKTQTELPQYDLDPNDPNTPAYMRKARGQGAPEKTEPEKGHGYNVLEDPAVTEAAPGITTMERLFTNLKDHAFDPVSKRFAADRNRLDPATRAMLNQTPAGDGTYFSWAPAAASGKGSNITIITQKPAWTAIEDKVAEQRKNPGGKK
jgi:hypothetical protein